VEKHLCTEVAYRRICTHSHIVYKNTAFGLVQILEYVIEVQGFSAIRKDLKILFSSYILCVE
jgi:hypothetical protein